MNNIIARKHPSSARSFNKHIDNTIYKVKWILFKIKSKYLRKCWIDVILTIFISFIFWIISTTTRSKISPTPKLKIILDKGIITTDSKWSIHHNYHNHTWTQEKHVCYRSYLPCELHLLLLRYHQTSECHLHWGELI